MSIPSDSETSRVNELFPNVNQELDFTTKRFKALEKIAWGFPIAGRVNIRRSLHEQLVHGRTIVVAHDVGLHLTWREGTIFVKPLPAGLRAQDIVNIGESRNSHACGFLKSYLNLIQHPVDLRVAIDEKLMPWTPFYDECSPKRSLAQQWASWNELRRKIDELGTRGAKFKMHSRYEYGELRISRLNLIAAVRSMSPWEHFFHPQSRHLDYWSSYSKWVIIVFAFLSILLSSLQVSRAAIVDNAGQSVVNGVYTSNSPLWFQRGCRYTGYITVAFTLLVILGAFGLLVFWVSFNMARWGLEKRPRIWHKQQNVIPI